MKIPEKLRIGGIEYDVEIVEYLTAGSEVLYGSIDYGNSVIDISDSSARSHQAKCVTMLHEALHGIVNFANLDLKTADEEQIIDTMAKGLYAFLQDNARNLFDIETPKEEIK